MSKQAKLFFISVLISFIGSLPFGILNMTALRLSATEGTQQAFWFSVAAVIVEIIIVRITLNKKLKISERTTPYLILIAIPFLLYLSANAFMLFAKGRQIEIVAHPFLEMKSSFALGLLLSVLNPMHAPFWMSWNRILQAKNILESRSISKNTYVLGICLGSLGALSVYILSGQAIVNYYFQNSLKMEFMMGVLYLLFSIILITKLPKFILNIKLRHKNASDIC